MRILVTGWFSFELMGATAGDLLSKDIVCDWLKSENILFDVALEKPFDGGMDWKVVNPEKYSHVIFICGPFGNGQPLTEFLKKFSECKLIGLNLSMLQNLDEWNPFDLLIERDSSRTTNPDFVFLSNQPKVPVVGLILVEPQKEYKGKARHKEANDAIYELLENNDCAIINIDTRLDVPNKWSLRTPEEIESVISKMDVIVTTRLHGMVLGLKNGIPVLAIDAIEGGAKINMQAQTIKWPNAFIINQFKKEELQEGFEYCLSPEARIKTKSSKDLATSLLQEKKKLLINFIS